MTCDNITRTYSLDQPFIVVWAIRGNYCLNQSFNEPESCLYQSWNKVSMNEICANLICINWTQQLVLMRFGLDESHCMILSKFYPIWKIKFNQQLLVVCNWSPDSKFIKVSNVKLYSTIITISYSRYSPKSNFEDIHWWNYLIIYDYKIFQQTFIRLEKVLSE